MRAVIVLILLVAPLAACADEVPGLTSGSRLPSPPPTEAPQASFPIMINPASQGAEFGVWRYSVDVTTGETNVLAHLPPYSGELSPDASRVAYRKEGYLWVKDLSTGSETRLAPFPLDPSWSPDGRLLAFRQYIPSAGRSGLGVASVDGETQWSRDVVGDVKDWVPDPDWPDGGPRPELGEWTWSPDSQRLAVTVRDGDSRAEESDSLFVIGANGQRVRKLAGRFEHGFASSVWSPDGNKVALYIDGAVSQVDVERGDTAEIGEGLAFGSSQPWDPNGDRMLLTRFEQLGPKEFKYDLVLADLYSGSMIDITKTEENEMYPVWSPDARLIAFWRRVDGDQLFVTDAQSGEEWVLGERTLRHSGISGQEPVWSPDSSKVAVFGRGGGSSGIWMVGLDGSRVTQLVKIGDDFEYEDLRWSEDGRSVLFTLARDPICEACSR